MSQTTWKKNKETKGKRTKLLVSVRSAEPTRRWRKSRMGAHPSGNAGWTGSLRGQKLFLARHGDSWLVALKARKAPPRLCTNLLLTSSWCWWPWSPLLSITFSQPSFDLFSGLCCVALFSSPSNGGLHESCSRGYTSCRLTAHRYRWLCGWFQSTCSAHWSLNWRIFWEINGVISCWWWSFSLGPIMGSISHSSPCWKRLSMDF